MPAEFLGVPRGFSRARLRRTIDAVLRHLGLADAELSIRIVREKDIVAANRKFFGRADPTDVISISQIEGEPGPSPEKWVGDILVSIDAARDQARQLGHSLERELEVLCVHGLLHNLGMDDRTPRQRRAMMSKTYRLLRRARV